MPEIVFTVSGAHPDTGEKLYSLRIGGKIIEDGLTIDQVICRISREDKSLGEKHITLPEDRLSRHSRR